MPPDPRFETLRARLLARPRPGAWLGLVIRAFPAADLGEGPPHWLVAGWRADDDGLVPRLPEFAAIASPDRERALAELLVHLPPGEPVHLATPEHVDAALVAEMVLEVDRNLQPWHRAGLRAFADAQRDADRARIRGRYTDREDAYERLRERLLGDAHRGGGAGPGTDGAPDPGQSEGGDAGGGTGGGGGGGSGGSGAGTGDGGAGAGGGAGGGTGGD